MNITTTKDGKSYIGPFLLISSLFFLWGFAHAILEVLNPHFKSLLGLTHTDSSWIQVATYGAYFLMAIPAGRIIRSWGYRGGVIVGLALYGVGALLFLPICWLTLGMRDPAVLYPAFVAALFVIGCGLTCLETSANPYVTVLGDASQAERRINFAQSFNGLGWICGPLVGGMMFFSGSDDVSDSDVVDVAVPYCVLGIFVLLAAVLFSFIKLPEITDNEQNEIADEGNLASDVMVKKPVRKSVLSILRNPLFAMGVIALFLYVAAQTGINSNFVSYMNETAGVSKSDASLWLAFGGMGLFLVGRLMGSWVMMFVRPERLLMLNAIFATLGSIVVVLLSGWVSLVAFFLIYLCESIMFPTIFSLALKDAKGYTKQASSFLIMTIVGGALAPYIMGRIADAKGIDMAFVVPAVCFMFIAIYAARVARKIKSERAKP